jgi:uncharacterized protein YjbI with pentapeptide repeats
MIVAIGFGWINAAKQAKHWQAQAWRLQQRLLAADTQLKLRRLAEKPADETRHPGFLYETNLEGGDFRDIKIRIGAAAFQKTWLVGAKLPNATIVAGDRSFQHARFDHANLRNARMTGGGGAFQLASFAGADLSHAALTGGGASFQGASFRDADLTGATIRCPPSGSAFQVVDIDSAKFPDADLSAIEAADLRSCHFSAAPTYNDRTLFPPGFDPIDVGWKRVP